MSMRRLLLRRSLATTAVPPPPADNLARNNAIMGVSLLSFVVGVFYYTVSRMKSVSTLGPEFDEKLNTAADKCDACEAKKAA